jgi:predicted kinase
MSTKKKQQLTQKLFIQMSGAPGSGKSPVSRLLGRSIGDTVVIDHDVLRLSLLESNVPFKQVAEQAYQMQWKLA